MDQMLQTPDDALEQKSGDSERLDKVFAEAQERFTAAVIPQLPVRAQALAARRFVSIPGAQWEGEGDEDSLTTIKIEIDKVSTGLEKIFRDWRDNRVVPDFRPAGGDADPETANTLDGIHRADDYHFKGSQGRDNAFEEGSAGGFGAWRLTTQWADPYDKDSDAQRINPALTIVDADQRVFFDPNSKLYDKSDARFCFVLTAMSPEAFKREYGDDCAASWPEDRLERWSQYQWYQPEVVIIAEYYAVEERDEKLWIFTQDLTGEERREWSSDLTPEDMAELAAQGFVGRTRRQRRLRIHKYVMSGEKVLRDQGFIAGSCIPVVPFYGKRWYIDGVEWFRGYVQKKMDAQRVYNRKVSKLHEHDELAPREIPIFLRDQMPPDLAEQWGNQNRDRHAYALVDPVLGADGTPIAMGPIGKVEPIQVPPVTAALLQVAANDLTEDMAEPDEAKSNVSAAAMDIASTRVDAKSNIYLDNMRQSVQREGEVYVSMAGDVYYEPGREVDTMDEDGGDSTATLIEAAIGDDSVYRIRNDFTRGRYKCIADVTEATATRRDKAVKTNLYVADVAAKAGNTELANVALLTAVLNQDGEGSDVTQKFARKSLVALGAMEPNDEEKAEMEQAAQQQKPDPTALALEAQAEDFKASAALKAKQAQLAEANTGKAIADTGLSKAKAIETLASAREKQAAPGIKIADQRMRISMGRDLAA